MRTHFSLLDDMTDHLPGTRLQALVGQRLKAHLVAVEGGSLGGTVVRGSEGHGDQSQRSLEGIPRLLPAFLFPIQRPS